MAIEVDTRDCVSLSHSDFKEMADLCTGSPNEFSTDSLSEQSELWVLFTEAREDEVLKGFAFCTLERIGGTPCVLIGAGHVGRIDGRSMVLAAIVSDQMRRAALSFPDEDVLFGAQVNDPGAFEAFSRFHDVIPRPGCKPTGEDRAWGRRLAKRFGISLFRYEDRSFTSRARKWPPAVLDHMSSQPEMNSPEMAAVLEGLICSDGDTVVVHGWARSEELEALV